MVEAEILDVYEVSDSQSNNSYVLQFSISEYPGEFETDPISATEYDEETAIKRVEQAAKAVANKQESNELSPNSTDFTGGDFGDQFSEARTELKQNGNAAAKYEALVEELSNIKSNRDTSISSTREGPTPEQLITRAQRGYVQSRLLELSERCQSAEEKYQDGRYSAARKEFISMSNHVKELKQRIDRDAEPILTLPRNVRERFEPSNKDDTDHQDDQKFGSLWNLIESLETECDRYQKLANSLQKDK